VKNPRTEILSNSHGATFYESGKAAPVGGCDHPALPSKACEIYARLGHRLRQVFGLTGCLLAPASRFIAKPVLRLELSFLITAAGQLRILTGFPFSLFLKADTGNNFSIDQINPGNNVTNLPAAAMSKTRQVIVRTPLFQTSEENRLPLMPGFRHNWAEAYSVPNASPIFTFEVNRIRLGELENLSSRDLDTPILPPKETPCDRLTQIFTYADDFG
jgi:hypothetical protein